MSLVSLRHSTLLTSQYGNPFSKVSSLPKIIKGLTHFMTSWLNSNLFQHVFHKLHHLFGSNIFCHHTRSAQVLTILMDPNTQLLKEQCLTTIKEMVEMKVVPY